MIANQIQNSKNNTLPTLTNENPESNESLECFKDMGNEFLKGVWVPYMDLDVHECEDTQNAFKDKFDKIVKSAKGHGLNTLIVHIRSHSDAIYPSKIFPWSHVLTGIQGQPQNFDPLKYMIETSHSNNLKFHAWINPLRVSSVSIPEKICTNNPCNSEAYKDKLIKHSGGIIYNPAYPEVRELVCSGVKEVVQNYEIDAIHFDDYFYPEIKNMTEKDSAYEKYTQKFANQDQLSLEDWRTNNINLLIKDVNKAIKDTKPNVKFGISPPGNLKKCKETGIDIPKWIDEEYIDYICPQIYWSLDFKAMPFERTLNCWKNITKNKNIKTYIGLALYKIGTTADENTWKNSEYILRNEYDLIKKNLLNGAVLYSWGYLDKPECQKELSNLSCALK